jgi:hypothetical protein
VTFVMRSYPQTEPWSPNVPSDPQIRSLCSLWFGPTLICGPFLKSSDQRAVALSGA